MIRPAFVLALACVPLFIGCASDVMQQNTADVAPQRQKRKQEVIAQFEGRRNGAQYQAAMQCWERGDNAGCQSNLEQLLQRSPEHHDARIMLADLLMVSGRTEAAHHHLTLVLQQAPDHAPAHHALALLFESNSQLQQAMTHFRRALQLDPNNEIYQMGLSSCERDVAVATRQQDSDVQPAGFNGY